MVLERKDDFENFEKKYCNDVTDYLLLYTTEFDDALDIELKQFILTIFSLNFPLNNDIKIDNVNVSAFTMLPMPIFRMMPIVGKGTGYKYHWIVTRIPIGYYHLEEFNIISRSIGQSIYDKNRVFLRYYSEI